VPDNVSDLLLRLQNEILETVAYGESLSHVADLLCRRAEHLAPGTICSILTVDNSGLLHPLASPSLPIHYSDALTGCQSVPRSAHVERQRSAVRKWSSKISRTILSGPTSRL